MLFGCSMSSLLIIHWFDKTLSNDVTAFYVLGCCYKLLLIVIRL
jgi:hypothetical protein